jgi:hypothetical protein
MNDVQCISKHDCRVCILEHCQICEAGERFYQIVFDRQDPAGRKDGVNDCEKRTESMHMLEHWEECYLRDVGKATPVSVLMLLWLLSSKTLPEAKRIVNVHASVHASPHRPGVKLCGGCRPKTHSGDPQFSKALAGIEVIPYTD